MSIVEYRLNICNAMRVTNYPSGITWSPNNHQNKSILNWIVLHFHFTFLYRAKPTRHFFSITIVNLHFERFTKKMVRLRFTLILFDMNQHACPWASLCILLNRDFHLQYRSINANKTQISSEKKTKRFHFKWKSFKSMN